MKITLLSALTAILLFTACEKDYSEENGSLPSNTTTAGGGTGSGGSGTGGGSSNLSNCKDCIYYPVCSGSVYKYSDTTAVGTVFNSTNNLLYIKDTIMENKTFQKVDGASEPNTFFNCTAGVTTAITINPGGAPITRTTVLKANEPVGATWSENVYVAGQNLNYNNTIISKGLPRTVAGITYADVIKVKVLVSINILGTNTLAASADYYYARGVGLIEGYVYDDIGNVDDHVVLTSSLIP
jgi:hypothetical protein